ncbi:MAG: hypothetical protein KJ799_18165 [Bacteroidetes bacterium]|nr:hypothetical protein [Bacteroidota bacterium]MBU1678904.1 hypothetical protein [Bacteroidota bacterium]MBU2508625.1 hypothetical protein [Bacteroidota bacterium]
MKTKATVIIIITLLVGFALGFFTHVLLMENRLNDISGLRKRGGITRHFLNRLEVSDEKKDTIRTIIRQYEEKFKSHSESSRAEMKYLMDSLKSELQPFLTEEQLRILDRPQFMIPKNYRNRGRFNQNPHME